MSLDGVYFNGGGAAVKKKPIENKTDLEKIIEESSKSAKQYLPKLSEGLKEVIRLFDEGKDEEAVMMFATAIEGLEWFSVFQSALYLMEPCINPEETPVFQKVMKELVNAWETHNFLLMSDILEFELLPLLDKNMETLNNYSFPKH